MGEPGFWDDPEGAAKVNAEYSRANRRLESFTALQSDVDDLEGLAELADEDQEMAGEFDPDLDHEAVEEPGQIRALEAPGELPQGDGVLGHPVHPVLVPVSVLSPVSILPGLRPLLRVVEDDSVPPGRPPRGVGLDAPAQVQPACGG